MIKYYKIIYFKYYFFWKSEVRCQGSFQKICCLFKNECIPLKMVHSSGERCL